jgi:tetratricopeptide (TPR) repeat protein
MTAADGINNEQASGYLGRILDYSNAPVGICFQVAPGLLVTAWHVLDLAGVTANDTRVRVEPLIGKGSFDATVLRVDPLRDLGLLKIGKRLRTVAQPLIRTDPIHSRTKITVMGCAVSDSRSDICQVLGVPGEWAGEVTRDDAIPLNQIISNAIVPEMSGAPVIRNYDGAVAGVVSGRYNSADDWRQGTAWVTRIEDLTPLLDGVIDIILQPEDRVQPADLLMVVTNERVRLTGPGFEVAVRHNGIRPSLAEAVNEARRSRARVGLGKHAEEQTRARVPHSELLGRAARLLGESFLPEPILGEIAKALSEAERMNQSVRMGLVVSPELASLPWETLPSPNDHGALALHPLVSLYRKTNSTTGKILPGPLRIVVAVAAPDTGGPLLDYERELRNVLTAVRAARQDAADVRVVPFATPSAIRQELSNGPTHILHISGHGSPGTLNLENDDGSVLPVSADEFIDLAIPPGGMPSVITLSACYTNTAVGITSNSFAAKVCQRGAAAVIATETSITDTYATKLFARVYSTLAQAGNPDIVAALAEARRKVQAELQTSSNLRDTELAGFGEWAAVTILASSGSVPVIDPNRSRLAAQQSSRPSIAGLATRQDWYFAGRRREQRRWPADLIKSTLTGIVLYGIGGIGKTALAAEIAIRMKDLEPRRILISLTGALTLESLLGAVISAIRRELSIKSQRTSVYHALDMAARVDLGWRERLTILRIHVLDQVPILLLLDNFEDNLRQDGEAGYSVSDEVLAQILAAWVIDPGASRVLITSRYLFTLPGGAHRALSFRQLGALTRAETMKLAWSLPSLDQLDQGQLERVWRLVGGHPRSLEYLDALLSGGAARYSDVTARLASALGHRLAKSDRHHFLSGGAELDSALVETVALAAGDVLLDELLDRLAGISGAIDLFTRISVYREPVDLNAVLFLDGAGLSIDQIFDLPGFPRDLAARLAAHIANLPIPPFHPDPRLQQQIDACEAASLLSVDRETSQTRFFVHRWTAAELARRASHKPGLQLTEAHRQAAAYWQWREKVWPPEETVGVHDLLEARYHLIQAGDIEGAGHVTEQACTQLHTWGALDQETSLVRDMLARLPAESSRQGAWIHQLGVLAAARGDYNEAERHYQRALDINKRLGNEIGIAATHHQLGVVALHRRDYDDAERQYQRALDINERLDNQADIAITYHNLGMIAEERGNYEEAQRLQRRALDLGERLGSQKVVAAVYHQLGILAYHQGNYDEAGRQFQRALEINERLGDRAMMAAIYHQLGVLAQSQDDYYKAEQQYRRALGISERLGYQAFVADISQNLGVLASRRGDRDEAERQYRRALEINEWLGNQVGVATTYQNLGKIAEDRRDYDEAERQYQRALSINKEHSNQVGVAAGYHRLGNVAYLRRNNEEAAQYYRLSQEINERLGDPRGLAADYHQQGMIAQARGDYDEAKRQYQEALSINRRLNNRIAMALNYVQLGVLTQANNDYDEAERQYRRALGIYKRLGSQEGMANTCTRLGDLERERGGSVTMTVTWHTQALIIRLRSNLAGGNRNVHVLADCRRELGVDPFSSLLLQTAGATDLADKISSMIEETGKEMASTEQLDQVISLLDRLIERAKGNGE